MSLFHKHRIPPAEPDIFGLLTRNKPATEEDVVPGVQSLLEEDEGTWPDLDQVPCKVDLRKHARSDTSPIPATADREGYCGDDHLAFWQNGLTDYLRVQQAMERHCQADGPMHTLDMGCASGRVLRHYAAHLPQDADVWGVDIDTANVNWVTEHLPERITVFQNSVLPHLPLPDASLNCISAFSVFTHIDRFEDTWLLELRRLLRPGGIAYITVHSERVWTRIAERPTSLQMMMNCQTHTPELNINKELFEAPMPQERLVLRWATTGVYRCNTFHSTDYLRRRWGRFFEVCAIYDGGQQAFQDIVILRRRA